MNRSSFPLELKGTPRSFFPVLRKVLGAPVGDGWRRAAIVALVMPFVLLGSTVAGAGTPEESRARATRKLQDVLDGVRARLGLEAAVRVVLVPENPYLVSVRAATPREQGFVLELEEGMLAALTPDELEAVLAHELGHVWVFTHHPYLQTELLANQIAMRVVARDSLARVYQKIWERGGLKGDMTQFLGPVPAALPGGQQRGQRH